MSKAYLLLLLDISGPTTRITGADVFSEPYPTVELRRTKTLEITQTSGKTFEEALKKLSTAIFPPPGHPVTLAWVVPLLSERARKTLLDGRKSGQ